MMSPAFLDTGHVGRAQAAREHLEVDNFHRILSSETEQDLHRAAFVILRSLGDRPEAPHQPRWTTFELIDKEIIQRSRGLGALPPIKATYIGRKS